MFKLNIHGRAALACLLLATAAVSIPASANNCDVDADGDIDSYDVRLISLARNSPVTPGDPRDADGDGTATDDDMRHCTRKCALPLCASTLPNSPPSILPTTAMEALEGGLYSFNLEPESIGAGATGLPLG